MAGLSDLTAQSIGAPNRFNWPWFVELCVCGIIALFFLFYFNRLFATLLSYGIRAYTWHHYRVWVDIQALQISLLGGRVFFKGVRYHGENETIVVHNGYITWRYWFRNVRHVDLTSSEKSRETKKVREGLDDESETSRRSPTNLDEESGTAKKHVNSEARIAIFVTGLEWFIYNRTPMYDAILRDDDGAGNADEVTHGSSTGAADSEALKIHLRSKLRRRPKSSETSSSEDSRTKTAGSEKLTFIEDDAPESNGRRSTTTTDVGSAESDVTAIQSALIQLFPVYVECSRAAISIGNEHTRAILVTTVDKAKGHIDASGCGPNDLFRQMFEFDIEHPVVQMRPNPDFAGTQYSLAEQLITASSPLSTKQRWWRWNIHLQRRKHKAIQTLRNLVPGLQSSVESLHHSKSRSDDRVFYMPFADTDPDGGEWHGLSRYVDENDADDHQAWAHIDYARFSTVLDCPSIHMIFYWDSPGRVKAEHYSMAHDGSFENINGVEAPAYGLDLTVRGGDVNYGPWTDRLRAEIQSVFLPTSYKSLKPAKMLGVGEWRQSTAMVIRIDIEEEVTMRVPTRESSKDWRWRGRATAVRDAAAIRKQRQRRHFRLRRGPKALLGPDIRPFGWMSFSVSADSSVRYEMDMVASRQGYRNQLQLDLKNTRATSSVNHADLWRCSNQKLQCDLSNPLTWNSQHTWNFNIQNQSMDMFLLRDHMFLLTDLITDFTAGQKSSYMTFVPFEYKIELRFDDLKVFLNANDFNIIDNPCDLDSNAFMILGMHELKGEVDIPMRYFSASQSSVHFRAKGNDLFLDLKMPVWNTLHSFSTDENMGTLKQLDLGGSYNYNAGTSAQLTDSLFMDIIGGAPKFHLQGFLIRYFMNVQENYFGEDLHFRTLEEYQNRLGLDNQFVVEDQRRPAKTDNDLDVVLNVRAENSCALMPANIYVGEENLRVDVMLVEADMRFTNYYMDLQVNSSPIEVSVEKSDAQQGRIKRDTTACQLYISAVSVYGHRLFGAPPAEPTYVCNWDFDVGSVYGECSPRFLRVFIAAIQAFVFTLDDDENALPVTRATAVDDVIFLRARVSGIQIWVVTDMAAFSVGAGRTTISFNDWAGQNFSKNLRACIPSITLSAVEPQSSLRHQDESKQPVSTLACIQTTVHIANIDKKAEFEHQRQLQQDHVKFHDLRTYRASYLLHNHTPLNVLPKEIQWSQEPPAMPVPDLPAPISGASKPGRDIPRRTLQRGSGHQSSFLSSRSDISLAKPSTCSSELSVAHGANAAEARKTYPNHIGENRGRTPGSFMDNIREDSKSTPKDTPFSSPWIEPHFPLSGVQPDLSQMPSIATALPGNGLSDHRGDGAEQDYVDSDESLPHAAIFCSLPKGIQGFCSPLLFPAVVNLLQGLVPHDPHSLLDMVQQSTVTNIKNLTAEHRGGKLDFAIYIPVAAIRLVDAELHSERLTNLSADSYDVSVFHARLNGRVAPTVTRSTQGQTKGNIMLLQASISNVDVSVAEKLRSDTKNAANLHASVRDIEFWLSLQDEVRTKLQVGLLNVATGGSTVDRLSMLVERSRVMITNIAEEFEKLDFAYAARHLIYHLSLLHTDTADPVFLSKPSYVLRSATEHIRWADSWKIVARFRQRLLSETPEYRADLVNHASCLFERRQEKAQQQILESIDNWKTLDRNHEACGPVLAAIFGEAKNADKALSKVDDLEIGVYLSQISFVLDPGPYQSELVLQSGDLNFSQKPIFERRDQRNSRDLGRRSRMRVQLWFADMALDLNWNLIELARSLVKQSNLSTAIAESSTKNPSSATMSAPDELDLMITAGTDAATAKIRTINTNLYMASQSLKASVAVQQLGTNSTMSLLLASSSAQLKMASQYRKLFNWKLQAPTIYGMYRRNGHGLDKPDTARLAASCDRLRFDMKEDILCVLEVVETVIRDEAAIIQEVVNSIEQQTAAVKPKTKSASPKLEDIHVAFFLNNYKLHFCLLPSLHYNIVGMVARTSIVPQRMSKYVVYVDIKKNRHTLIEPNSKRRSPAAALEIPPISGKFVIAANEEQINVNARSTLELVTIEASAVQACIETAYRPQNIERLKDGKVIIDNIQNSIKHLQKNAIGKDTTIQPKQNPGKVLLYSGFAVFEGFDIHCSAPSVQDHADRADLKFGLRETTLRIHNYRKANKVPLDQPQFEVNLRQVFFGLFRQTQWGTRNHGRFGMGLKLKGTTQVGPEGDQTQNYQLQSESLQLDLFTGTAALVVDLATYLQGRITEMTTVEERRRIKPLRRLTLANNDVKITPTELPDDASDSAPSSNLFNSTLSLELNAIQVRWIVADDPQAAFGRVPEDLVFSIRQIDLRTQRESSAKLTILDTQLQTVPKNQVNAVIRTSNSALLPEMIFNAAHFSTKKDRRFAFQAAGKALDLRLAADGILPLSTVQRSLARAAGDLNDAKMTQLASEESPGRPVTSFLGNKRLASLLVDADFAGAVVKITPRAEEDVNTRSSDFGMLKGQKRSKAGRYGQAVQSDTAQEAVLRAPGIAVKVEYIDTSNGDPTLSTEVKVAASSNTLAPSVVPLILEMYSSIKEIIGEDSSKESKSDTKTPAQKYLTEAANTETDPTAILGRVKLNAGLWVQRQEFSLTCQPVARVAATARFDEIVVAINTVQDGEQERFFSIITTFNKLQTSVQHVYSRESTASFEVDSIVMSLMNSKHVNAKNGISAILNISPMRASLNARQLQDFLLFREIWYPAELRHSSKPPTPTTTANESQAYTMQKYRELAATAALPWHAIVAIHELKLEIDFGQSLGKSSFMISKLWASSKKNSDWEQNLCVGFDRIGIDSSGRMSGFIELKELRARTSIRWPVTKDSGVRAPLVQASVGFGHLRLKTAFDYQPFAVADVSSFEFLMYNVRPNKDGDSDRLVGILNGGKVQVFCISAAAAQALSIVQAFERLVQEKREAFQDSLHEVDRLLRRKSLFPSNTTTADGPSEPNHKACAVKRESHRLHTDVVVTLKVVDIGAFPNTFFDNQILKVEAVDAQARFAVASIEDRLRSGLGMTLGQVRVALSTVNKPNTKALGEVEIGEVIERATSSRGGTILKVPRLVASMQTWQEAQSNVVEYIFRSTFQGKVDVGWNYSRIRFIRGMWDTHSQALAHRLGKPLPPAAVQITAETRDDGSREPGQEKITAVVNVPQSTKFQYVALEPPVIDTPQLRDMGEATPPLEWIGLHRDKLPNVTHSIVIVSLLEVAKEVEDAYTSILGTG